MKKLILLALCAAFALSLCACGGESQPTASPSERPTYAPSPTPTPDPIKTSVREALAESYSDDDIEMVNVSKGLAQARIQTGLPASSEAPDSWEDITATAIAASNAVVDALEGEITSASISLLDTDGAIILTASSGKISYDKFDDSYNVAYNAPTITLDEFNHLSEGMTYEQACSIIGGEGTVFSEIHSGDYSLVTYEWDGEAAFSSASLSFEDGLLTTKIQIGLE